MWLLSEHACRACGGRILSRKVPSGQWEHLCSACEARATGDVRLVCHCGTRAGGVWVACGRREDRLPPEPVIVAIVHEASGG